MFRTGIPRRHGSPLLSLSNARPGSNGAVRDGWERILAEQLDSRNRPCNFVELMPRLNETWAVSTFSGQIILLHGASSSGKSSIARELLRQLPAPYLHFSFDRLRDDKAMAMERFRSGEFAWAGVRQSLFVAYERAIAALASAGLSLIVDYIMETREWFERVEQALSDFDVFLVGVHCPLKELERREIARGDRPLGDARRDFLMIHQHCTYDSKSIRRYPRR